MNRLSWEQFPIGRTIEESKNYEIIMRGLKEKNIPYTINTNEIGGVLLIDFNGKRIKISCHGEEISMETMAWTTYTASYYPKSIVFDIIDYTRG